MSYLASKSGVTLKTALGLRDIASYCLLLVRVRSRLLELAPFDRSCTSSYSPSIVTSDILYRLRDGDLLVENREIFIPHLYLAPPHGVTPSEFCENV